MIRVRYYRIKNGVALVFDARQWASRNLRAKGYTHSVAERDATPYEVAELDGATRLWAINYRPLDFAALADDERECGVSAEFIEELRRRLTPHQPDAAITPAGGGSEPVAAQVMFNG